MPVSTKEKDVSLKLLQKDLIERLEDIRGPKDERRRKPNIKALNRVIENIDQGPDENILKLFAAAGASHTNPNSWYGLLGLCADFVFENGLEPIRRRGGVKPKWVKKPSAKTFEDDFIAAVSSNLSLNGMNICKKMMSTNPARYANVNPGTILREIPNLNLKIREMKAKARKLAK